MSEKPSEEMLRIADEKYDTDLEDFEESESARYWAGRFAELEARLDDSVPSSLHEELRQVMLGERRRAEQAERERDEARGRAELAAHNGKVEYQRAEDYWKQLTAAQQENARLRGALQRIEDSDAALSNYGLYALVHNALAAGEVKP